MNPERRVKLHRIRGRVIEAAAWTVLAAGPVALAVGVADLKFGGGASLTQKAEQTKNPEDIAAAQSRQNADTLIITLGAADTLGGVVGALNTLAVQGIYRRTQL